MCPEMNYVEHLNSIRETGMKPEEIVVLSFQSPNDGILQSTMEPHLASMVHTASDHPDGKILFSSIHAYKGLEAPCIILVDAKGDLSTPRQKALMYVGLTRCTAMSALLMHDQARIDLA